MSKKEQKANLKEVSDKITHMMNEFDIKIGKITKEQLETKETNKKKVLAVKVEGSRSTIADTTSSPDPESPEMSPTFDADATASKGDELSASPMTIMESPKFMSQKFTMNPTSV